VENHGDAPIGRATRPSRGSPNEIAGAPSHRPAGEYERLLSEIARRLFNKIKHFRRIAVRYDKLAKISSRRQTRRNLYLATQS
jgi:hypothetical protein